MRRTCLAIVATCVIGSAGPVSAIASLGDSGAHGSSAAETPAFELRLVMIDQLAGTGLAIRRHVPVEIVVDVWWASGSRWRVTESAWLRRGGRATLTIIERRGGRLDTTVGARETTSRANRFSLVAAISDDLLRMPNVLTAPWSIAKCGPKLTYQLNGPVLLGIRTEVLHRSAVRCGFSNDAPAWNGRSTIWFDPQSSLVLRAVLHTLDGRLAATYTVTKLRGAARRFVQESAPKYP